MNILDTIKRLSEERKEATEFVAPVLAGSPVYIHISGISVRLQPRDKKFEGWGRFSVSGKQADLVRDADIFEIADYNKPLLKHDFILIKRIKGSSWLGFPKNTEVFNKRFGVVQPTLIHLVENASPLDEVQASFAGNFFYHEHKSVSFEITDYLTDSLQKIREPKDLKFVGLTSTHRIVYESLFSELEDADPRKRDEKRIRAILTSHNGKLERVTEGRSNTWTVEWRDSHGQKTITTITKDNFRVATAGYCLSNGDKDFNFQAVVGLKELRWIKEGH